jgi:hypothetical protein
MKVFAHHDLEGAIHSFVSVDAPAGAGMMLVPKPGLLVTEIEGLSLKAGGTNHEELRALAKSHKVTVPRGRLTKQA